MKTIFLTLLMLLTLTLNAQTKVVITITTKKSNVTCYGKNDGYILTEIKGGAEPYKVKWLYSDKKTVVDSTQNLMNLKEGVYYIKVVDKNGKTSEKMESIAQPKTALSVSTVKTAANCYNGKGMVGLKINGGSGSYKFKWNTNDTNQNLVNKAGLYTCVITDANGCKVSVTDTIKEPKQITLTTTFTPITCYGGLSTYQNTITNAVLPLAKTEIFDSLNKPFISNSGKLPSGKYRFRITDKNGCTMETIGFIKINQPNKMVISENIYEPSSKKASNGAIKVSVTNGVLPYSYKWSNGFKTDSISKLKVDTYEVTVTDKNGCKLSKSFNLTYTSKSNSTPTKSKINYIDNVYPNPADKIINVQYKVDGKSEAYLKFIRFQGGNEDYIIKLDSSKNETSVDIYNLGNTTYIIQLIVDDKFADSKRIIIQH